MNNQRPRFAPSRRQFLAGSGAVGLFLSSGSTAGAQNVLSTTDLGIKTNSTADQSRALQDAINSAAAKGVPLFLPSGTYLAERLNLPSGASLIGVQGRSVLQGFGRTPVLIGENVSDISLVGLGIKGRLGSPESVNLMRFEKVSYLHCDRLQIVDGGGNGLRLDGCAGRVTNCHFSGFGLSALHAQDSAGLLLSDNEISACANGGIRVWRSAPGADGTIVINNRIFAIGSQSGNGQNGNGVNVFRANEVIVADNQISDCDFSAVRLNGTDNTIVRGNMCTNLREVAIFSEFSFSGSIIANNIVDEAAYGISMTNYDQGGRLAVCTGNMVRNIWPSSPTNPDTRPVGIMAQADAAVSGNVVENVPGVGIAAGWGPFLRNVLIANNNVRNTKVGIGVSIAEGTGAAKVTGNIISESEFRAISGFAWAEPKGSDLIENPDQFANIAVSNNSAS